MAISNSTARFNIGRDCTIVVTHPLAANGGRVELPNVMDFKSKQETSQIKALRLDGVNLHANIPVGWSGSFELERAGPGVDQFFATMEQAWRVSGAYYAGQLYQYVTEPDGAVTTFQYDDVAFMFTNAGDWKGDQSIKQTIEFQANTRKQV